MAISDSARDFWDRISSRERVLVVLLAIAVPIGIALWLGLAIHDGLVAMDERNERTREALKIVEETKARGPQTQQTEEKIEIPNDPVMLETYLSNAATAAGFTIRGKSPRPPVTKNGFVTSSVTFNLEDLDIDKLKKFFEEVELKNKVVFTTYLKIKRDFRDKKKIDASVEVSSYSKEKKEKKEGEDKKDDDKGSATGSDKKGG